MHLNHTKTYRAHDPSPIQAAHGSTQKLTSISLKKQILSNANRRKPIEALRAEFIALTGISIYKRILVTDSDGYSNCRSQKTFTRLITILNNYRNGYLVLVTRTALHVHETATY
jgi:hypothetical protein